MALRKDQIEDEITKLKEEIKEISHKEERHPDDSPSVLIKYLMDERDRAKEEKDRTIRVLNGLTERIKEMEHRLNGYVEMEAREVMPAQMAGLDEIPLSSLEAKLLSFVKERMMVCADDVKTLMNYKGRNAACARLNKLCSAGFLQKVQLGHKVYYRIDAGKATKALIISPPQ